MEKWTFFHCSWFRFAVRCTCDFSVRMIWSLLGRWMVLYHRRCSRYLKDYSRLLQELKVALKCIVLGHSGWFCPIVAQFHRFVEIITWIVS